MLSVYNDSLFGIGACCPSQNCDLVFPPINFLDLCNQSMLFGVCDCSASPANANGDLVFASRFKTGGDFFLAFFFFRPGFSSFLGTEGQGHGARDAPRGCGVETRGPGLGSQPSNASTHLYIYTYLCIYIYTHSYI